MRWWVEYAPRAARSLRRLDSRVARRIFDAIGRLSDLEDPTGPCKALSGPLVGLRRLRVGQYRVVVDVQRDQLVIIAIDVGPGEGRHERRP